MRGLWFFLNLLVVNNSARAEVIGTYYNQTLIKPLGYLSPRLPPAGVRVVSLEDLKISFHAKQICGYTDWSSAVVSLPRSLLSAEYWGKVGNKLKQEAINSVLAISGALPSMLACNASPTFCAILNRAEALAQANLKFTFDSCQMLEGLSDVTKAQFDSLRGCVKSEVNGQSQDASVAIDRCTVGDRDPSKVNSKAKEEKASGNSKDGYNAEQLTNKLCREETFDGYSSSSHAYNISSYSCKWVKEFFPGISVEASGEIRHGGTFSLSPAEDAYDDHVHKSSTYLVEVLDLMHQIRHGLGPYSSAGPKPRHLVVSHSDVKRKLGLRDDGKVIGVCYPDDGRNCQANIAKLPPVYKLSSGSSVPALMVSPQSIYDLVEVIPKNSSPSMEYKKESSRIALAIEPLIQSVSFTRASDLVKDSITRLRESCEDPDMQSPAAQHDCALRLSKLKQSNENLQARSEADKNHLLAQMQFYQDVDRLKAGQFRTSKPGTSRSLDPIGLPNEIE